LQKIGYHRWWWGKYGMYLFVVKTMSGMISKECDVYSGGINILLVGKKLSRLIVIIRTGGLSPRMCLFTHTPLWIRGKVGIVIFLRVSD
jgi:hypothetical protein